MPIVPSGGQPLWPNECLDVRALHDGSVFVRVLREKTDCVSICLQGRQYHTYCSVLRAMFDVFLCRQERAHIDTVRYLSFGRCVDSNLSAQRW